MSLNKKINISLSAILLSSIIPFKISYANNNDDKTSKATFSVIGDSNNPESEALILRQVPDFNFGALNEKQVQSGISNKNALTDGKVVIQDTRFGNTAWTLTISMGKLSNGSLELDGASMAMFSKGSLGGELSGLITDQNISTELIKCQNIHGTNEFTIRSENAKLSIAPNPELEVKGQNNLFSTTLNWNLSLEQPIAPPI